MMYQYHINMSSKQERGELRNDQPAERVAGFISLVANGIAAQVALGEPIRDVDALLEFVRAAVEPGAFRASSDSASSQAPDQ